MSKRKNRGRNLLRQKKLAKKLLENTGKPMGQLMKESGYKPGYCKNPQDLKQTLSWQELMDKYLDDTSAAREHHRQIRAKKIIVINKSGVKVSDNDSRLKAIDMHYKLRGYYKGTQAEDEVAKTLRELVDRATRLLPDSK